jgi:hypothetical protein
MNLEIQPTEASSIIYPFFTVVVVDLDADDPVAAFRDRKHAEIFLQQINGKIVPDQIVGFDNHGFFHS